MAVKLSLLTLPDPLCPFGWAALLPAGPVGICLGSLLVTGAFWRNWLFWALCTSGLVPGLENILGTTAVMGLPCVASVPCSTSWELSLLQPLPLSGAGTRILAKGKLRLRQDPSIWAPF